MVLRGLAAAGFFAAWVGVGFAGHYLLTVNWPVEGPDVLLIKQLGGVIHALSPRLSELPNLHKNITGSALTMAIPLGLIPLIWSWEKKKRPLFWISIALTLFNGLGLLMTVSRGAWLGLFVGGVLAGYLVWRGRRPAGGRKTVVLDGVVVGLAIAASTWSWFVLLRPAFFIDLAAQLGLGGASGRINLWVDSLLLLRDYWFTGSGLGNATMIYSSYIYLLHVPYIPHAHLLLQEIVIEQGVVGLVSFVMMAVVAGVAVVQGSQEGPRAELLMRAATLMALLAILVHGTVEAGLYAHEIIHGLFYPLGFAVALTRLRPSRQNISPRYLALPMLLPAVIWLMPLVTASGRAALAANLGAVEQTRTELSVYEWPTWPLQDELRRDPAIDLAGAEAQYQKALELNPQNTTALRRLGQIALARGQFEAAADYLTRALAENDRQRPVRQMLGEVYAVQGRPEEAAALWQTVDLSQGQLDLRSWWVDNREDAEVAANFAAARQLFEAGR